MNAQVETGASVVDTVKQVGCAVLAVASIGVFYYFAEIALLYRVIGLLLALAAVVGILSTTMLGHSVIGFYAESRQEVRKIVWPTRDETLKTTLLVFAMVTIVGTVLWLLDTLLFWGVRLLTGQG